MIYFRNALAPLGFELPPLSKESNGNLFIAWYFETCNSLPRLFTAVYNPKGKVRFFDRKKQNKNKNQSIVQKAIHSTSTPNVILLKEQKHLNHICGFRIMSNDHEQLQTPCNRPCLSYMLHRSISNYLLTARRST